MDGSTDGTIEHFTERDEAGSAVVHVVTHPGNTHLGRAATRNLALPLIDTDYVWFVDSDMVLAPEALSEHLALVTSRPCASQGHVLSLRTPVTLRGRGTSTLARTIDVRTGPSSRSPGTRLPNSMVRAEHVQAVGGFDGRFVGYGGEDFDFAYRLERLSGEPLINNARARASTVENKTVEQALRQFEEYGTTRTCTSSSRYIRRCRERSNCSEWVRRPWLTGCSWPALDSLLRKRSMDPSLGMVRAGYVTTF